MECKYQLSEMLHLIEERKVTIQLQLKSVEFDRESFEFLQWLNGKRQQAQSEEYGQDFEHLAIINAKFLVLKDEVNSFVEPRYADVKRLSASLLSAKSPETKSIRKKMDELKTTRELLEEELHNRELTLASAAEIHCFNKDVQDLLRRINDKEAAFGGVELTIGRDTESCESLIRKHEIFIEELTAIEVQLRELNKQSELLRTKHPGDTAESVAAETDELIDRFRTLLRKTEKRSRELRQASDYFKFLAYIRVVTDWTELTRRAISEQPVPVDLFAVSQQRQEHDQLRSEMTQRDDMFKDLDEMCIHLTTKQAHPNKREILAQTNIAMSSREDLFRLWKLRSDLLESLHELQLFYRELVQLVASLSSQESILAKACNESAQQLSQGGSWRVEDLEALIKNHENLEKKIERQSFDKAAELIRLSELLVDRETKRLLLPEQVEFGIDERATIAQRVNQMNSKQVEVRHFCVKRARQLNELLSLSCLRRDIDEFEAWIEERVRFARGLKSLVAAVFLNDKVKLFQKQKALGTEIETNSKRLQDLLRRCDFQLSNNKTVGHSQFQQMADDLNLKWNELCGEYQLRSDEFAEAKDILEFNDQLDQVEERLKENELMLQNGDTGRDYEHCMLLCRRADEAISTSSEQKLQQVIHMGDKLVRQGRTDRDSVLEKKNRLLERYKRVTERMSHYKGRLNFALEIHSFNRDYDDLSQRISEKILLLNNDLDLRSLDSVQAAQTKVLELESDLKAIKQRLEALNNEALGFINSSHHLVDSHDNSLECFNMLKLKMSFTESEIANLDRSLQIRKKKLNSALSYQKFMVEYRDLKSWIIDLFNRMNQQPEPTNLSEAETAMNLHQERKTEIDGKRYRFMMFQQMGNELNERVRANSGADSASVENQREISRIMKELGDAQQELEMKCNEKQRLLQECAEYQDLRESWKQLENWSKNIESSLRSVDAGDSLLNVKSLLTKHEHIENAVRLQTAPAAAFDSIENRGLDMVKLKFSQAPLAIKLVAACKEKRKDLDALCLNRRKLLEDSLMFQNFLLNYYETQQWIKEKTASALDKTYLDLTNLLTKIQRHQAFIVDLKKNGVKRIEDLHKEAEALVSRHQTTALSMGPNSSRIIAEIEE